MPKIYARETKLHNPVGRSNYINDKERQEEIVLSKQFIKYSWNDYYEYETNHKKSTFDNIVAREIVVALPNELYLEPKVLEQVCDDLGHNLYGFNRDFEYAVHWNHDRTNLHAHYIYSERERILEPSPKVYKRDIWIDKQTNKLAKVNAEGAELRFRKGDVQKDENGNIRYTSDLFTSKDTKYKNKHWLQERNIIIQTTLKEHGYTLDIQNKDTPYLSQVKLFKGAREDYLSHAKNFNNSVKIYNQSVKQLIDLDPHQKDNFIQIKKEVNQDILSFNSQDKSLSDKSIHHLQKLSHTIQQVFKNLYEQVLNYSEPIALKVRDTIGNLLHISEQKSVIKDTKKELSHTQNKELDNLSYDIEVEKFEQQEKQQTHRHKHKHNFSL